jgi:SAM-dependent methyltransferase
MVESGSGTGGRRLLSWPRPYKLLQVAVGSHVSHRTFVRDHVRPAAGDRLLDIGCGPGHILRALPPDLEYVGVDRSPEYIAAARRDWGERGDFVCAAVEEASFPGRRFDIVMAMGLLHHLDDSACASLFSLVDAVMAPGGRFVAVDPAYAPGQPWSARWLISRDRGAHVRGPEGYAGLARPWFRSVRLTVRSDLLRVPYTHAVLTAAAGDRAGRSASS